MAHLVNRTFDEIKLGDTASATRTLGAGDLRAWGTVVGNQDSLTAAGESQDAAGMVTAMMVALVGSALPGPGTSVRACSVRIEGPLPDGPRRAGRILLADDEESVRSLTTAILKREHFLLYYIGLSADRSREQRSRF